MKSDGKMDFEHTNEYGAQNYTLSKLHYPKLKMCDIPGKSYEAGVADSLEPHLKILHKIAS